MSWFRTKAGHLVHAVGEVAAVYRARGLHEVDDQAATTEVESGHAQKVADASATAARVMDSVEFTTETHPELSPEDEAEVDQIIAEHPQVMTPKPKTQRKSRKTPDGED